MKADTQAEENAFELEGLVIKPRVANSRALPGAAPRPKNELFARITQRHTRLLANVEGVPSVIVFIHLMIHSVKVFNHPFALPVDYLTKETGMDRRAQLRTLRNLAKSRIIKVEYGSRYDLPIIAIPGTTKTTRRTT